MVAVGPGARGEAGNVIPMSVAVGDKVRLGIYSKFNSNIKSFLLGFATRVWRQQAGNGGGRVPSLQRNRHRGETSINL